MIYFGFYFNVKDAIPASQDPTLEFLRKFAIGLTSGTISSCVNIPFDVAKSRIQGPQPVPGQIKYRSCFQTMKLVYREEGYLALYKGLIPKIMRLGPGGAVMLLVYEYVSGWLQRNWTPQHPPYAFETNQPPEDLLGTVIQFAVLSRLRILT
ncbi:hypothetical protein JZ751_003158 [Albula glossodonta]|uniref:Mitochondrial 2-oxodicarboxylate carrier n=1 Tax=Albula glossodonta TaxID=121402 RepID=A0A8T2NBW7_9TELE|nr:hypothetical protein JZ751_003158 [Albula glossodonta]